MDCQRVGAMTAPGRVDRMSVAWLSPTLIAAFLLSVGLGWGAVRASARIRGAQQVWERDSGAGILRRRSAPAGRP